MILAPKEKAKDLVNMFLGLEYVLFQHDGEPFTFPQGRINFYSAKQCALLALKEIIESNRNVIGIIINGDYWLEVLEELEKL